MKMNTTSTSNAYTFDEEFHTPRQESSTDTNDTLGMDDLLYDDFLASSEQPFLPLDDFFDLDLAEFGMQDLVAGGSERRLSMAFSRRLSITASAYEEPNSKRPRRCEPIVTAYEDEKEWPGSRANTTSSTTSTWYASDISSDDEILFTTDIPAIPVNQEDTSNSSRPEILSLMSPEDLRIQLEQTKSRLADSMERSALSRKHVDAQAEKMASSYHEEQHEKQRSNSSALIQSGMQIASSFISNHVSYHNTF